MSKYKEIVRRNAAKLPEPRSFIRSILWSLDAFRLDSNTHVRLDYHPEPYKKLYVGSHFNNVGELMTKAKESLELPHR